MDKLTSFTIDTVGVLSRLIEAGSYTHALIILYSSIDTLAWTNIQSGNVTRAHFCNWINKYMKPEENLGCTAIDLYSARCAIVHSFGSESSLSKEGNAKEIWYVSSPASRDTLQEYANQLNPNTIAIHITDLVSAFIIASESYQADINRNPEKRTMVNQRMQKWLKFVPAKSINNTTSIKNDP